MGAAVLGALASSWRVRELNAEGLSPSHPGTKGRFIYAYWHEYIIPTVGHYRGLPIHALASRSFDGDLVSRAMLKLGYPEAARGSSSRDGASGLLGLLRDLKHGDHVAVTVDGPRGPRRRAQEGVLQLARLSGHSIVPVGYASSSKARLRSWDRSLIPLPFSRGVFCMGSAIQVGREEAVTAVMLQKLQDGLDQATLRAEEAL